MVSISNLRTEFDKPRPLKAFKSDASIRHLMEGARPRLLPATPFLIANVNSHCSRHIELSSYKATAIECAAFVRLNAKLKFQFDTARSLCELVRGTSHTRLPPTTILMCFKIATVYGDIIILIFLYFL